MQLHILLLAFCFVDNVFSCIISTKDELEQNYCKSTTCPNYGKCKMDENRLYSLSHTKCICSAECTENEIAPALVDSLKAMKLRTNEAVCGTDGNDYDSVCQLRHESCLYNKEIKVKYIGKCGKSISRIFKYWPKSRLINALK